MYRRRRVVALLLLLAVLALLTWGVVALVGTLTGAADGAAAEAAPAEAADSAGGAPAEAAAPPTEPSQPVACAAADLAADLAGPEQAAAGAGLRFSLTVTNSGQGPCMVDAGSAALAVTVASGRDRVWSSADCPAGPTERMLLLAAGDSAQVNITWPGARSAAGCSGDEGSVPAGSYRAQAELHGAPLEESTTVIDVG